MPLLQLATTQVISHPDKDETVIIRTERFDGLLDHNAALRNEGIHGSKEWRHVANIPGALIEAYCYTTGVSWAEFWGTQVHMKALLNDPSLAYFRVAPGRV